MAKKSTEQLDPEEIELIEWGIEVEGLLVAAGASEREAQAYLEEEAEWFTDLFFEGYSPEQAAQEALA